MQTADTAVAAVSLKQLDQVPFRYTLAQLEDRSKIIKPFSGAVTAAVLAKRGNSSPLLVLLKSKIAELAGVVVPIPTYRQS